VNDQPAVSLVDLPDDVEIEGRFDVYVNGILQEYGSDYSLDGRTLVFPRTLTAEVKMTKFQLVRAALGIAGTYSKHDSVDITYHHNGRNLVATGLRPRNDSDPD
jgi:hypothetical protein